MCSWLFSHYHLSIRYPFSTLVPTCRLLTKLLQWMATKVPFYSITVLVLASFTVVWFSEHSSLQANTDSFDFLSCQDPEIILYLIFFLHFIFTTFFPLWKAVVACCNSHYLSSFAYFSAMPFRSKLADASQSFFPLERKTAESKRIAVAMICVLKTSTSSHKWSLLPHLHFATRNREVSAWL